MQVEFRPECIETTFVSYQLHSEQVSWFNTIYQLLFEVLWSVIVEVARI